MLEAEFAAVVWCVELSPLVSLSTSDSITNGRFFDLHPYDFLI